MEKTMDTFDVTLTGQPESGLERTAKGSRTINNPGHSL
jgi:hypothetical protein